VKLKGRPTRARAIVAPENEGTRPTVSVNACVAVPTELVAVKVIGNVLPAIAVVALPDNLAVPLQRCW
jgi:hypothetical protein